MNPLQQIKAALSVIQGDRLWLKFGHGRFVLLRRDGDGWQAHHTRLEISKEQSQAKGYSDDVRSRSRSLSLEGRTDGLEQLLSISRAEDGGIFWVPAGIDSDLPLKEYIDKASVVSCEIDSATRDEQQQRYEWFNQVSGLNYGLQLTSGSKSIHSHIFIDEPIPINEAVRLRRLFVLALLGDPAVTRPHQPMRFPGFFRREKGNYQELLSANDARYSVRQIEAGLQAAFAALGWAFPETISAEFWADLQRALKKEMPADEMRGKIGELLQRGDGFYAERAKARAEQRSQFAQKQLSGEFSLFDAVGQVEQTLSATEAFSAAGHDWDFSGNNHARGRCQWHPGKTNSAWLSQVSGKWVFHCPSCTDDQPISAFQYWHYDRHSVGRMPRGKDWAIAAEEWLGFHGVAVPARQAATKAGTVAKPAAKPAAKPKTSAKKVKSAVETKAAKAAARLINKLRKEREQWVKVAQEVDPTFAQTDDIESDIKRAKRIAFTATTTGVEYDQTIKNTGGAFDEATLESLMKFTAPVIIGGQTGGGKTELATQLAAYALEQNSGLNYGAIAPTQVLSVQLAERFEQKGLPMESTAILGKREGNTKKPKALPAESLWKTKGNPLDFLAADEPDQWVPRVLTGILGDAADANLAVIRDLARKTPHQLWLNAAPNPITADLIGELSGRQPIILDLQREQAKKPVSVDWYRDGLSEKGFPVMGSGQLYQDFIDTGRSGKKALLLAGSVKKARAIRTQLRKRGIKVLLKDGRYTPKKQRLGFALAPEKAMQNYDVVILTRLVETGLDLQQDFDAVYVALSPKMEARSAYQFLSRSRSLLRGDTPKLCIYSPDNTLTGIEQLSPDYWAERLRKDNKTYTGLLRGDTSKVFAKLGAIEWAIGYQARYKADSAQQTFFRNELLRAKFKSLGWRIENEFSPNEKNSISDALQEEILRADWMEAACTARGHRSITDYPEAYAEQISDPNQQGLILECKRRKLELSSLLPASDLEDVSLIFQLSQDERLLPQTLLWSAIEIDPHSERMQKLLTFLNSAHIEKFELYGALEGLKNLRKSKSMLTLAIAEVLAGDPCLERVRKGDDVIHKHQADTQQLAAKLNENSDIINAWCRRHFGREFAWGEGCVSVVCKALDKLLGVKSAATGQTTEQAKGKSARARNYRTGFSAEGQAAIAKDSDSETKADDLLFDYVRRLSLMESAKRGWLNKIEESESYIERKYGGLHTKTNTSDLDTDFSVQADMAYSPPPPPQPSFEQPELLLVAGSSPTKQRSETQNHDPLADTYYDSSAWV